METLFKTGLGGTCVNVGCIPKKLMHQSAVLGEGLHESKEYGWQTPDGGKKNKLFRKIFYHNKLMHAYFLVTHNWDTMRDNIQNYIGSLNFNYRVQLRDKKVDYLNAYGTFVDRNKLLVSHNFLFFS